MIQDLAALLAPMSVEDFLRDYYGKKPLHLKGSADKVAGVMNWDILSGLLSQTGMWSAKTLELVLDRKRLEPQDYASRAPGRDGVDTWLIDPPRVKGWLKRGASLVANDIDSLHPGVKRTAAALEEGLGGKVQANLYCSWQAHQAFGSHFDTHDVFALHVEGAKTWRVYGCPIDSPIAHPRFKSLGKDFHEANKGPITQTVTLEPGDLLYLPRGWYHDALATSDAVIHIAFGLTAPIGLDVLSMLFETAVEEPLFRHALPEPGRDGTAAFARQLDRLGERLKELARNPGFRTAAEAAVRAYRYNREDISLPGDAAVDRWQVARDRFRLAQVQGRWALVEGRNGTPVPGGLEDKLRWVLDRPAFAEDELAEAFPQLQSHERRKLLGDLANMQVIAA